MASFGESLKRERELRGVTLREVAEGTKISVRFLDAIESGRVEILPGGLFPRSFVRQYAAYLGLDPERAVADFLFEQKAQAPPAPPPRSTKPAVDVKRVAYGLAIVMVLAGLVLVRQLKASRASEAQVALEPSAVAPPPSFPSDRVFPPPSPTEGPPLAAAEGLVLALSASEDCWVAVEADGVKVLDQVLSEGETRTLNAKNELLLSVGNAGGIVLSVNGHSGVRLGRPGEVRRNIQITRESLRSLLEAIPDATPNS